MDGIGVRKGEGERGNWDESFVRVRAAMGKGRSGSGVRQ